MFTQPKSIFTGATPSSTSPDDRRLSTPERREALNPPPEGSQPRTPVEQPSSALSPPPERPWVLQRPLGIPTATSRPSSAPLSGAEAFKASKAPQPPTTPPVVAGVKRAAPRTRDDAPATEPLHKRRRLHVRAHHSLDLFDRATNRPLRYDGQPPSPLFFSSKRARPHLPARFSSSEAAARMLSKTRGEDGGIKTVTLARGTFSGLSPPGTTSVASGRSSERSSIPRTSSPDVRDRNDPLKLLGSVGVVELLEHDTRPTFIVDIGDYATYPPETSPLQILFANNALRSDASIWETVAGKPPEQPADEASSHASSQFRGWLLGTATQGDDWDANPTPVEHGGIVWSCYTLRRRLRIVSGATSAFTAAQIPSTSASVEFAIPSASSMGHRPGRTLDTASLSNHTSEQQDYFGPPVTQENDEPNALNTMTHDHMNNTATNAFSDLSGLKPHPNRVALPSIEDAIFTNECVLRAHSAGDVDSFHREPKAPQNHDMGFFDWTRLALSSSLPEHIQFARSIDWASTALGPIECWSNDLRAMCNLIM
jgi:hypothetical protein